MMNTSKITRIIGLGFAAICLLFLSGHFEEADAQTRDPFAKPGWARTRDARPGPAGGERQGPAPVTAVVAPPIEQRIAYYYQLRENAAANGQPIPRVTSVLTLDEMQVTGIFRTPRGLAAMVEATPIKLSYTIYPGERFFDGQLVAIEENRVVFRKVTKMSNGNFVAAVENKALRHFSTRAAIQGTAPQGAEPDNSVPANRIEAASVAPIISPLDEMNNRKETADKPATPARRPTRVARGNN
jgi:hypothetical protein